MRIAVVTPWFPDPDGTGVGQFVLKEAQALINAGHAIRVIYLNRDLPAGAAIVRHVGEIPILELGIHVRNPWHVFRYRGLLGKATAFSDVIHSHAISSIPFVAALRSGKRWVHSEHWSALTAPESLPAWASPAVPVLGQLERLPDTVIGESERLVTALRSLLPAGSTPVLIPCVVPAPQHLQPRPENGSVLHLASTGGLIDRKDPILAVETLAELASRGVPASLRWVGEGPLRGAAEQRAKELGVDATFLGAQPYEVVEQEIADCDIFFAPTKGENFFVAAAEALVNGRPLCAGVNGGHVEYAPEAYSEIVSTQTPEAYAEAIIRLRDKTQGVSAQEISESVAPKFSPATIASGLEDVYLSGF